MSLYTERHNMRLPISKTSNISIAAYSLLYDCCTRYFDYLAWKYPEECQDGCGCCGFNSDKFNEAMMFEIPNLFRREGIIDKPRSIYNAFENDFEDDEYDQYALLDLIEYVAQNIKDIIQKDYHGFFRHHHLSFGTTSEITSTFIHDINEIFSKTGLLYHLTNKLEVERDEESAILSEEIENNIKSVTEQGLRDLLLLAVKKHKSPYPDDQKDAVEKIWDAFERLKTYYKDMTKRGSADKIVHDMSKCQTDYIKLFDSEFKELTDIGNNFRIRHHETNKIDITDIKYYDYFFNRCLALISTAILYLE